jgi:hypothetical protein
VIRHARNQEAHTVANIKINARDMIVQISDGAGTPAWLDIEGLTTVTPKPGENEETVDTTTFTSQGAYEQEIMQRGASMEVEGFAIVDSTDGEPAPGQARVEAAAALVGSASLVDFRFRHVTNTTTWKVWKATVSVGDQGGGNNDKGSWSATFTRSGAATTAAVSP